MTDRTPWWVWLIGLGVVVAVALSLILPRLREAPPEQAPVATATATDPTLPTATPTETETMTPSPSEKPVEGESQARDHAEAFVSSYFVPDPQWDDYTKQLSAALAPHAVDGEDGSTAVGMGTDAGTLLPEEFKQYSQNVDSAQVLSVDTESLARPDGTWDMDVSIRSSAQMKNGTAQNSSALFRVVSGTKDQDWKVESIKYLRQQ